MNGKVLHLKRHTVIISLHEPREKIWGILLRLLPEGIWVHGIDLHSFDDWTRQISDADQDEPVIGMSTMFFPMHRIERIVIDERAGLAASLKETFKSRVGQDIFEWVDWDKIQSIFEI